MKKVRINELARELEVKPGVILDLLPEFGVQEKKTHSSSIDEEVAIQLRARLTDSEDGRTQTPESSNGHRKDREETRESSRAHQESSGPQTAIAEAEPPAEDLPPPAPSITPAAPSARPFQAPLRPPLRETAAAPIEPDAPQTTPAPGAVSNAPAIESIPHAEPERPTFHPLRPPLGGSRGAVHPPLAPPSTHGAGSGPVNRSISIPARPAPSGGTSLSGSVPAGPRAPLPPETRPRTAPPQVPVRPAGAPELSAAPPAAPAPPQPKAPPVPTHLVAPGPAPSAPSASAIPGTPMPRPTPSRPSSGLTPGAPIAPRPQGSRPALAGQPAVRPVVPPRPDLVKRLQQTRPAPSAPGRPAPAPGQPIYRGPVRPGQPVMRGPGIPTGPIQPGQRRPGLRPPHPTTPLRAEPSTPLPTEQRRHQAKPGLRQAIRKREDLEEGNLRQRVSKPAAVLAPPPIDREITVAEGVTVKELSEKLGVKANLVVKKLVEKKIFATINQTLDVKLAEELAREFGASTNQVSYEQESTQDIELAEETRDLVRRAPVVTVMGHVDHGKTSLLDAIRQTNVAGREAGGITQHIGAYHVEKNGRKIVFIDTPGHQAFTRMRARGAKVTDVVVLVVSADDGVMPQTLEAIDHAKAAAVPIVVAINKIDKPSAQPERVKQQLADRGLLAEDWGGETVTVPVSAKTGQNLDLLLEMILLVSDLLDLKANPNRPALGTVLEAQLDRGRGPVATMLVRNGTLRVGDHFICGALFSKVRAMFDDRGNPAKEAEPSMPVEVIGLESLPEVGDSFQVVSDTSKAKQIVIYREAKAREAAMAKGARVATLASLNEQFKEGELKDLNLIIKADVGGTAEVLSDTLQQLSNEKVRVRVLRAGVGAITEDDVLLASASDAVIVGFNVRPERSAQSTAEQQKVDIRLHSIIYELIDEVQRAMTGLLEPVYKETVQGHAEVRETFKISKVGTVAGCYVADGVIRRDSQIRVVRGGEVIHTARIDSLKRFKNDASEVKNGLECGISLVNFNSVQIGDTLEAFTMERIAPEVPASQHA
ncbi:MAG: translation initiation factor IF-2 [Acidobacteriaceae bacterium]|nr:translation initiation factor IF-2 [Acidobacteriaceae bacterium]MBV9779932.1 translation initiation factor IF-2 [Acidobacteriaceae bacterium]